MKSAPEQTRVEESPNNKGRYFHGREDVYSGRC
jgi:hypothetical protein